MQFIDFCRQCFSSGSFPTSGDQKTRKETRKATICIGSTAHRTCQEVSRPFTGSMNTKCEHTLLFLPRSISSSSSFPRTRRVRKVTGRWLPLVRRTPFLVSSLTFVVCGVSSHRGGRGQEKREVHRDLFAEGVASRRVRVTSDSKIGCHLGGFRALS